MTVDSCRNIAIALIDRKATHLAPTVVVAPFSKGARRGAPVVLFAADKSDGI